MLDLDACQVYDIDFGTVNSGCTYNKTFSDPHYLQIMEITQYMDTSCMDSRFELCVDEKDRSSINIRFIPGRPSAFYCNYFKVVNKAGQVYTLHFTALTEDVVVTTSRRLIEISAPKRGETKLTSFTLHNPSKSLATFQFQFDQQQNDITLKPGYGKIRPGESVKVVITFTPITKGITYRILYCFVRQHPPLLIEIQTYCQKPNKDIIANKLGFVELVPKPRPTFEYLFDVEDKLDLVCDDELAVRAPILLDRNFIYLGSKTQSSGDGPVSATVTATNTSPVNIHLRWQTDRRGVFEVIPNSMVILRGCKAVFTVTFKPTSFDNFFSAILAGSLHWANNFSFIAPFQVTLNVIGHSFEEDRFGWLAEYKVPKKVIMPPCVPGLRSWTTFTLKRCGHLPIMFRFLPADRSSYKFIPEHGVITEEFQMIIVQFTPGLIAGITHREKRRLIVNTSTLVDIEFVGTTENPNLWFPKGDKLEFPPTPVNCTLKSYVQVKNVTRHYLKFNFETLKNDLIESCTPESFIRPGEQKKLWLSFSPKVVGSFEATRYLTISCQDENSGKIVDNKHLIQFSGSAVYPRLTCVPENLSLGNVHRDEGIDSFFVISNSGECTCFIKFRILPKESLSVFSQFEFNPECITLDPRKDVKIQVSLTPDTSGYQSFEVLTEICKTETFEEEIVSLHLLNINYFCYSYRFKILDILNLDGDSVTVPKFHLWNILNIDGFNDKMKKSSIEFSEETVEMKVPELELGTQNLRISLLLENTTDICCTFQITKCTPCDCPPFTTKTGYVLDRPDYLCPHRSQIYFDPPSLEFQPKKKKRITITVLFNDPTVTVSIFNVQVYCTSRPSIRHSLTLNITRSIAYVNRLSADVCYHNISHNLSETSLENVFIGTPSPPLQAVWFYNNSGNSVDYSVTLHEDGETFELINPTGQIPPRSLYPLFIRFSPISPNQYKATLVCKLGEKEQTLYVGGKGVLQQVRNSLLLSTKMPLISEWTQKVTPISFSTNHLIVNNMSTHSTTKRIFQLKNKSDSKAIFKWTPTGIENVVSVDVTPKEGTIWPRSSVTISLIIRSYYSWFALTLTLRCGIITIAPNRRESRCSMMKSSHMSFFSKQTAKSNLIQTYLGPFGGLYQENDTKAAMANILSITVGVNCCSEEWMDRLPAGATKSGWKRPLPRGPCLIDWPLPPISPLLSSTIANLFSQIILDTLESKRCQREVSERRPPRYYTDLEAASSLPVVPCSVPCTVPFIGQLLDESLFETISNHLQL